jgi:hypothetical protein
MRLVGLQVSLASHFLLMFPRKWMETLRRASPYSAHVRITYCAPSDYYHPIFVLGQFRNLKLLIAKDQVQSYYTQSSYSQSSYSQSSCSQSSYGHSSCAKSFCAQSCYDSMQFQSERERERERGREREREREREITKVRAILFLNRQGKNEKFRQILKRMV